MSMPLDRILGGQTPPGADPGAERKGNLPPVGAPPPQGSQDPAQNPMGDIIALMIQLAQQGDPQAQQFVDMLMDELAKRQAGAPPSPQGPAPSRMPNLPTPGGPPSGGKPMPFMDALRRQQG